MAVVEQTALIDQYVTVDAGASADHAYLRDEGIDVWALVLYYQDAADRDPDTVAHDYHLTRAAVEAALAYYSRHKQIIDARITINTGLDR